MRFATARDVLLAYPKMQIGFQSALDDTPADSYLERLLADGKSGDAIAFTAHLLPRREAVWWAARCVRMEPGAFDPKEEAVIAAAELWVKEPSDESRRRVMAMADKIDVERAAGWVGRAAGWSGGALVDTGTEKVMSEPHMSHAAARAAVLMAFAGAADPLAFARRAVDEGISLLKRAADR